MNKTILIMAGYLLASTVQAQTCSKMYAVDPFDATAGGGLAQLNPTTGAFISAIEITLQGFILSGAQGMSVDPTDEQVYMVVKIDDDSRRLVTLDLVTGVATDIAELTNGGVGELLSSIAFDDTGQLWGVSGDGASVDTETLFTVDKTTAVMTVATALGNGDDGETLAFNPSDGLLYHRSGNNVPDIIFESIDPNTLVVIDIPLVNLTGREGFGLIFDSVSGLLLETNINGDLASIDPVTGEFLIIGNHGNEYRGPIFYPRQNDPNHIFCDSFDINVPAP